MRIRLPISVTDRSQITNLPADTQILKGRTTWRNLPSIFLILHDFDYLPRFFSVSNPMRRYRLPFGRYWSLNNSASVFNKRSAV
jgi:hypothetical protein